MENPKLEVAELFTNTLKNSVVEVDYCLGKHTTYRVGGNADIYICINSHTDLLEFCKVLPQSNLPVLIFGAGSNMLIGSSNFKGIALCLGEEFKQINFKENEIQAGGMAMLPTIARQAAQAGLAGFEWAVAVPGSIGGATRMNAGAHGSDISQSLKTAEVLNLENGEIKDWEVDELKMSYRSSALAPNQKINQQYLVLGAKLVLSIEDPEILNLKIKEITKWRRKNQPGGRNAGSVFKNPTEISAGQLLDEAGAKKLKVGSASVSSKHANFIQVKSNGRAEDVYNLMKEMRELVLQHSGIELEAETIVVNF